MKVNLHQKGFEVIEAIYTKSEINRILELLENKALKDEFGLRFFLVKNKELKDLIFTKKLKKIIKTIDFILKWFCNEWELRF